MTPQSITFKEYTDLFYKGIPEGFRYQSTPIQLYDLKVVAAYLKTPTPLMKAQFSFMVHLTAGYFELQVDLEIKKVSAGSVLLVGHGQITSLKYVSDDIAGFFILFENRIMNAVLANNELQKLFVVNPLIHLPVPDNQWVDHLNRLLYQEITGRAPNPNIYVSLFQAVLHKVVAAAPLGKGFSKPYEIAVKFRQLAYRHYVKEKQIAFYARQIGVSENYMNRCVKQVLGKSPKEILNEIAIVQAEFLLRDRSKSISEVAHQLNFTDPSYFGRAFKQITGHTPTAYRNCTLHDLSE